MGWDDPSYQNRINTRDFEFTFGFRGNVARFVKHNALMRSLLRMDLRGMPAEAIIIPPDREKFNNLLAICREKKCDVSLGLFQIEKHVGNLFLTFSPEMVWPKQQMIGRITIKSSFQEGVRFGLRRARDGYFPNSTLRQNVIKHPKAFLSETQKIFEYPQNDKAPLCANLSTPPKLG